MDLALHDITAVAPAAEHDPQMRAGLEALGWTLLGRLRYGTPEQLEEFVRDYDPAVAPSLLEKELIGATVMRAPDGSAFAFIDWFFECPYTRLFTLLDDGRLVETEEAWTRDPLLQTRLKHIHVFMNRRLEQARGTARGRSVELVDQPTAEGLAAAHHEHVSRVATTSGTQPQQHRTIGQSMDLWEQQLAHTTAVAMRAARLAGILPTLVVAPVFLTFVVLAWRDRGTGTTGLWWILCACTLVAVWSPVFWAQRLFTPLAYVRWIKPPFEGKALDRLAP